jgi:hypothetical protein
METMDYCSKNNVRGVIASIDQSKAFDSVDHMYMEKVYEFFGFGDRIKRWLKSIGTNRKACIQLDNNRASDTFDLGKGHAQGDSPSPLLYNLAAQIQIFKIEFNNNIQRIVSDNMTEYQAMVPCGIYKGEGFGQSEKNESFADDSSNLTVLTYESMAELKSVLDNFRKLSGLSCNLEKSFVMRIGNIDGDIPDNIANLGFSFANKIDLLGFTLNNYGNIATANYEKILVKINNLIRFWERFNLSLTGKLSVYKSLILPQINYTAAIMTPEAQHVDQIENALETFVTKGFSIAKERLYMPVKEGGLGMFKILDFIRGLQCNWIKRCYHLVNDNWRATLAKLGGG